MSPLADAGFATRIERVRTIAPDVREFTLRVADRPAPFWPGAHVEVALGIDGREETRSYSLVRAEPGAFVIAVRLDPGGRGGSRAMWSMRAGDSLQVRGPYREFEPRFGASEYLLIAGGIGITPMPGIAAALARAGHRVRLIQIARSADRLVYRDELDAIAGLETRRIATGADGRPDLSAAIAGCSAGAECYVCGPDSLLDAARRAWTGAGHAQARLRFERFGGGGPAEAFEVRVEDLGRTIHVPANRSMLDALEEAGVDLIAGCRRGQCGVCALTVRSVDGSLDHRDGFLAAAERAADARICPCVSRARGSVVIDSGYRADRAAGVQA